MLSSMTGYGRGESTGPHCTVAVELRSVNNRYCDVVLRNNKGFMQWDDEVRRIIQKNLKRGKIYVNINVEATNSNGDVSKLDSDAVKKYASLLEEIKKHAGIDEPIQLSHLLSNNNIYAQPSEIDEEDLHKLMLKALESALTQVENMRSEEGEKLSADITERINLIKEEVTSIKNISSDNASTQFEKLKVRAQELIGNEMEFDRLNQELALLSDKLDISEECVRIDSHVGQFTDYLTIDEPVGKRLDFLLQEMNRESNTISSKSNNVSISHIIVEMRNVIESLREQVQNII
ncbi:MAG: YicC family protein [Candidatus Marinimicrobia bacterium]|nr:YicC family protein [Candidatus Neomarinimicrobiota bacterium]